MLLHQLLDDMSRRRGGEPAVWFKGEWKTYGELAAMADGLASALRSCGIRRGERVALLMDNSIDYVAAHFAIFKAGAVNVSLNTETTADSLRYLLGDCEAKAVITGRKHALLVAEAARSLPGLSHAFLDHDPDPESLAAFPPSLGVLRLADAFASGEKCPDPPTVDIDLASLVYTSGSTGKPKGVMLSHLNLVSNSRSILGYLGLTAADRVLAVLPFYYIYGTSLLYTHFLAGGTVAIDNRFAFPNSVLDTMENLAVTGFAGVPSTFSILLSKSTLRKRRFPSLRYVTQAGGAMAPSVQKDVHGVFAPARLYIMYGSTEASPRLTYLDPDLLPRKWGSIGKAIPNVDVFIAGENGERLPQGAVGEIAGRGSNIMMGYWKDPQGTAEVMRGGCYLTGDLGREDEDGCLFVVGRTKDIIKAGGNRVSAKEIEEAILDMGGILEAAVIGVEDAILGEAIKALVVPSGSGLTEGAVMTHLKTVLPPFKQPKWVEFRESLPKNQAGKILKAALREGEAKKIVT